MAHPPSSPLPPEVPYLFGTKTMPSIELGNEIILQPNPLELMNLIKKRMLTTRESYFILKSEKSQHFYFNGKQFPFKILSLLETAFGWEQKAPLVRYSQDYITMRYETLIGIYGTTSFFMKDILDVLDFLFNNFFGFQLLDDHCLPHEHVKKITGGSSFLLIDLQ